MMYSNSLSKCNDSTSSIRNVCIIANEGDGQGTLMNELTESSSFPNSSLECFTPDSCERGSGGIGGMASLAAEGCRINLLRTAISSTETDISHVLKLVDGALLLVHCLKGTVPVGFKQALKERVQTVMMINKIDLLCDLSAEEVYQMFESICNSASNRINESVDWRITRLQLSGSNGTVAFGSSSQGWAFTIPQFARIYSSKFNIDEKTLCTRLWGNHFYNSKTNRWDTEEKTGYSRAFSALIWQPIISIVEASQNLQHDRIAKELSSFDIDYPAYMREMTDSKLLLRRVMKMWLPLDRAILPLLTQNLPTPSQASMYRYELYSKDQMARSAIKGCNPNGLLLIYATRTLKTSNGKRITLGRVFSGTVRTGSRLRVNISSGGEGDWQSPDLVSAPAGAKQEVVASVSAGGIVGLIGVEVSTKGCIMSNKGDVFVIGKDELENGNSDGEPDLPCPLRKHSKKQSPRKIDSAIWSGRKSAFEQYRQLFVDIELRMSQYDG